MEKGKIVILNGVSSSGKTTLARGLQEQSKEVFYRISIDDFCHMVPDKDFGWETFCHAVEIMVRTIQTISDMGLHIVVDVVLQESLGLQRKILGALKDYPVWLIHVHCPLEELRRRERTRGDREIGQGESQLTDLATGENYDLDIDTASEPIEVSAGRIISMLNRKEK